ncbi:MAG: O-antigen ligase family protein [Thermomonas sp.]|uniref:O-antigen ligase family protein n=1 Tax=Thermomonas sp. TaxID=1971895 RepID=UPI0039E50C24
MNSTTVATAAPGWRWAPAWVLAFVALWPAPGYAEGVLVLGALAGLVKLVASRFRGSAALLGGPAWALTTVLFFAYWLPQAISAVDAPNTLGKGGALGDALVDLRYLPFLWVVASAVANEEGRRRTFNGLAIIAGIWTLDALIEAVSGTSPLFWLLDQARQGISGKGMCTAAEVAAADRLSGILGPCNLKLGVVLASLSPFALDAAQRWFGRTGWLLAALGIGAVVMLAGARAAWLTYALVLLWSGWRLLGWRRLLGVFLAGALSLGAAVVFSPELGARMQRSAGVLQGDAEGVDHALSGRVRIWSAATCMVREHPVNGVGVGKHGFRVAFPDCDPNPAEPAAWGEGPALHAHQIVLEVLSETGVIGLLLWLAGAALAWRAWRYAGIDARERTRPAMLALAVSVFPFNTHLAAYSTFWGGVLLLLAALYAGSLWGRGARISDSAVARLRAGA